MTGAHCSMDLAQEYARHLEREIGCVESTSIWEFRVSVPHGEAGDYLEDVLEINIGDEAAVHPMLRLGSTLFFTLAVCKTAFRVNQIDIHTTSGSFRAKVDDASPYSEEIQVTFGGNENCTRNVLLTQKRHEIGACGGVLPKNVRFVGHRGMGMNHFYNAGEYVENTEDAFKQAVACGADWLEFDVHLSKDMVPVIFHDFHIASKGVQHLVSSITMAELESIYTSVYNPENKVAFGILGLDSVFRVVDSKVGFNIEIKYPSKEEADALATYEYIDPLVYVEKILGVVAKSGKKNVIFSSFHPLIVCALKIKAPQFPIYFLRDAPGGEENAYQALVNSTLLAHKLRIDGIVVDSLLLCYKVKEIISLLTKHGLSIMAYGEKANDVDFVRHMLELGIDGIITDRAEVVALQCEYMDRSCHAQT